MTTLFSPNYWTNMNVKKELYEIVKNSLSLVYEEVEIKDNLDFINDLGFDSITLMQLIVSVEEHFNITFDDDTDYKDVSNILLLEKYIKNKIDEGAL